MFHLKFTYLDVRLSRTRKNSQKNWGMVFFLVITRISCIGDMTVLGVFGKEEKLFE